MLLAVQATQIPGVAQRTGATTYYLEVMPAGGPQAPVLALNPAIGEVDVALARVVNLGVSRTMELRIEAFNLFNNFNWADPNTSLDAGTFGQINTQAGDPRIMQFAVKYGF